MGCPHGYQHPFKVDRCTANKKAPNFLEALYLLVENTGVEPVTSCLPGKRSSQLS